MVLGAQALCLLLRLRHVLNLLGGRNERDGGGMSWGWHAVGVVT